MINKFRGNHDFLSNFYPADVSYKGLTFLTNEAAFQAQKCRLDGDKMVFTMLSPADAKAKGRRVFLRPDWEEVKEEIMYEICKAKFTQNKGLGVKLIATWPQELIEGNTWGDTEWGVCGGLGANKLGKILMRVRDEIM